VTISLNR